MSDLSLTDLARNDTPASFAPSITLATNASVTHSDPASITAFTTTLSLQISQRLGAIGLFATLATWVMLYLARDASIAIGGTVAATNAGLCSALIARLLTSDRSTARREANGIAIFNLVLLVLAVHLMLYTRLEVIRSSAETFFTPTPVLHPELDR